MPVEGPQYPVNLLLAGRPVLVVGAGAVAAGKVQGLLDGGADDVTVVAPEVVAPVRALAEAGRIRLEERPYRSPEATRYRLVVTATDRGEVNRQVHDDAEAAGVWVNSADDPANCSFTLPARVRRGDLLLTVSTGGRSPAVAAYLRERLEAEFGPEWEGVLQVVSEVREELRAAGRSTEGLDWKSALDSVMLDLLRQDRAADAKEHLRTCLSSSSE